MATPTEREHLERILLGQAELMADVHALLRAEEKQDDLIRAVIRSSFQERPLAMKDLDRGRIYHRDSIRALCIKYRLRFLPSGHFTGPIPNEAVHALRVLHRRHRVKPVSFMLMAPARRFKLCDSEVDPLLFIPLDEQHYYLVHKWGSELSTWRAVLTWPLRSIVQLSFSVLVLAALLSFLIPSELLTGMPDAPFWGAHRVLAMVWTSMVCASFTVFGWFAFFGQFSVDAWNSRYFN